MVNCNGIPRHIISVASDNATLIKPVESAIGGFGAYNKSAGDIYVKWYDKSTAPTATDVPVFVWHVKAGTEDWLNGVDMRFSNGIGVRIVTGQADNDNTAVGAGDVVLSFTYS